MKYKKIINENIDGKNFYLYSLIFSMIIVSFLVYGIKGTYSAFGDITGVLSAPLKITYESNWPDSSLVNEKYEVDDKKTHTTLSNMFNVPEGYVFKGWNTSRDGTGTYYLVNKEFDLTSNILLYAQWGLPSDNDGGSENGSSSGDLNNDENLGDNTSDSDQSSGDSSDNLGSGSSSGGGSSGNGNASSGSGSSSGNSSGGGSSSGNASAGSSNNSSSSNKGNGSSSSNKKEEPKKVTYVFKFISDGREYSSTSCDTFENKTCQLVLPSENPFKEGYIFKGWSLNTYCSKDDVFTETVSVKESNIFYACFDSISKESEKEKHWIWFILAIWVIAAVTIYFVIKRFVKKEEIN